MDDAGDDQVNMVDDANADGNDENFNEPFEGNDAGARPWATGSQ